MVKVALRPLASHRKAVLAAALLLALAFSLLGLEAFRYAEVYEDLRDGRGLLLGASDRLEQRGLDVTRQELNDSEERLSRAQSKLAGAADVLGSDPALSLASRLPWIGRQVDAARDLADIGVESAGIGVEAVAALRTFQDTRDRQGGELSEKVVPVLDALQPHVMALEEDVSGVRVRRAAMSDTGLLGPLNSAVTQLDDRLNDLEARLMDYRRASQVAPKVLGYDGPQTYLVLAQDNTEILPTGGFILVYGFLTFDQGRIKRVFFDSVANIVEGEWPPTDGGVYVEPPQPLKVHLMGGWPMGLAEASWWPDFPTAAEKAMQLYRTNSGSEERIDGVIGINFFTLEELIEVLGPITVERYGETVSAEDVIEKTLIVTHPEGQRPWEIDRYDFTGYLAEDVIARTLSAGPTQWAPLLSALDTLGREKNLLIYHTDPAVQRVIADFDWDGGIGQARGDYLMVVDSNLGRNKLNQVVEPSINLDVYLDGEGDAANVATVSYRYDYSTWARQGDPRLVGLTTAWGSSTLHGSYVRLLAPGGSELREVALGGVPVEAEEVSAEGSTSSFGRYLSVPPDGTREVAFTYLSPSAVDMSENPYEYRLFVQKQPGTRAIPLIVTTEVPPGMRLLSSELDGEEWTGEPAQIVTDLGEDRQIVVTYAPGG